MINRKVFLTLLICCCSIHFSFGQYFFKEYGDEDFTASMYDMMLGEDGHIYGLATRLDATIGGNLRNYIELDASGNVLWTAPYPNPPYSTTRKLVSSGAVKPDVLINRRVYWSTGSYTDSVDTEIFRQNLNGDTIWSYYINYSFPYVAHFMESRQGKDKSVISFVNGDNRAADSDIVHVFKFDSTGSMVDSTLLNNHIDLPNEVGARDAVFTQSDGMLVLYGGKEYFNDPYKDFIVALDSAKNVLSVDSLGGTLLHPFLFPLAADSGFFLFSTFKDFMGYRNGLFVSRYDGNGVFMWKKRFDTGIGSYWSDAVLHDDGDITIMGKIIDAGGAASWETNLLHMGPAGDSLWSTSFASGQTYGFDNLDLADNGDFILYGSRFSCTGSGAGISCSVAELAIARLDSLGNFPAAEVSGKVFHDLNLNASWDLGEPPLREQIVTNTTYNIQAVTNLDGDFVMTSYDTSWQRFEMDAPMYWSLFSPAPDPWFDIYVDSVAVPTYALSDTLFFALEDSLVIQDLVVDGHSSVTRPMEEFLITLSIKNVGTYQMDSATIVLTYSDTVDFVSSIPPADSHVGNVLEWEVTDLAIYEQKEVYVTFFNPNVPIDTGWGTSTYPVPQHSVLAEPIATDYVVADNLYEFQTPTLYSYDPNDKMVEPAGIGENRVIDPETEWLKYKVRFQNTGNDTAFRVRITDYFDENLDLASFQMIGSSHPYTLSFSEANTLQWTFENILLPDSNTNFLESQGFITFRMRPKADLPLGTRIHNEAAIYFDYNYPVITNDAFVTLDLLNPIEPVDESGDDLGIFIYPNPATNVLNFHFEEGRVIDGLKAEIYSLDGRLCFSKAVFDQQIDISSIEAGLYQCIFFDGDRLVGKARLVVF